MTTDVDQRERLANAEATLLAIELLLIHAEQDGGKLIATEAIRQVLDGVAVDTHQLVIPDWPPYIVRHPEGCQPGCPVDAAAALTLNSNARYRPGVYNCGVGAEGWLNTTRAAS